MANQITTIKLTKETKNRLERLKEHPRETADQLIRKILWILSTARHDHTHAQETLDRIDEIRKRWAGKKKKEVTDSQK